MRAQILTEVVRITTAGFFSCRTCELHVSCRFALICGADHCHPPGAHSCCSGVKICLGVSIGVSQLCNRLRPIIKERLTKPASKAHQPSPSHHHLLSVTQPCFRAGNRSSGPDFGRTVIGKASQSAVRPALRPKFTPLQLALRREPQKNTNHDGRLPIGRRTCSFPAASTRRMSVVHEGFDWSPSPTRRVHVGFAILEHAPSDTLIFRASGHRVIISAGSGRDPQQLF